MSYNLTLTDRHGDVRTVYLAPDRVLEERECPLATNHRFDEPEDPAHARRFRSLERQAHLRGLLADEVPPDDVAATFYGHRCEAATTSMVSGRCTPPTTARTVARFTIGGPVPLGPGVSTRPTQKFAWTCPSADDRNIGL